MQGNHSEPSHVMAKERPVHEVRIGLIKAAIWKNDSPDGPRYNTTLTRLYKSGEKWESTDSFGRDDLLGVAKAADLAHTWVCDQVAQETQEKKDGQRDRR